jgi:hypothetical protein
MHFVKFFYTGKERNITSDGIISLTFGTVFSTANLLSICSRLDVDVFIMTGSDYESFLF